MAEPNVFAQLCEAVEATEIRGPTGYSWLGHPYDLPESVRLLAPSSGRRAALVNAIQWRLYADFFTAGGPVRPRSRPPRSRDRRFSQALSAANSARVRTDPGWWFVRTDGDRMVVERLGFHMWAEPDEVVHAGPGPPRPGDPVAVHMPAEAPNFSPGFYMAFSERGLDPDQPRLLDRYYLHIPAASAVRCVELVTTRLNAADVPFRLKVVDEPPNFGRCDAAVLTLQRKDRDAAAHHVLELYELLRPGLGERVPTLTRRLAPGLGFAENPVDGLSFGASRCRLIAGALVEAHEAGWLQADERMEVVRTHMASAGTTPETPYLGPHSAGEPRLPRPASLEQEAVTCRW